MAHFDLHEQEQISNLKYYWNRGGKYIVLVLVAAVAAYLGSVFWNWHNTSKATSAAAVYANFTNSVNSNDKTGALNYTYELENQYPNTEYSAMASLTTAKIVWKNNDSATAIKLLSWTIDNAKDQGLVSVARLRLADVYIDQKKFDKALQLMLEKHDPAFDALYYTKRGDLYIAKGDSTKARDAYKEALQKAGDDSNLSQGIQMRLDVLGNS